MQIMLLPNTNLLRIIWVTDPNICVRCDCANNKVIAVYFGHEHFIIETT